MAENMKGSGDNDIRRNTTDSRNKTTSDMSMMAKKWIHSCKPFTVTTEIDVIQWILFVVASATRLWRLDTPRAVVFDELFFGRFASMYPQHTFYFDAHPPLGKMIIALFGYYAGFHGEYKFEKIGAEYPAEVPVWHLRLFPALSGSLLVPVTYQIMVSLGLTRWTAALTASLIILDTALLTQSRFILLEMPLILAVAFAILSYLKFNEHKDQAFSVSWWFWLVALGASSTFAISIKYAGVFSVIVLFSLVGHDFWKLLPDQKYSQVDLYKQFASRVLCLLVLPSMLYVSVFYVHLFVLYKAGPHDDVMTSAFQASLEGGLASITKGQPLEVVYGSQITLRHTHSSRPCWLHSHAHVYPIRYPDGRGSSHQQQVTCYSFKDINNWWIVKDPKRNTLMVDDPVKPVKHGDIVQLIHGISSRALNSHDVAAPVSPQHQEVSCYIDYNISFTAQNLWRVEIVNKEEDNTWKMIQSHVRFVHVNTSQAVKISGKQLPEWGFHQYEVVGDRNMEHQQTVWNVEEHRYTRTQDQAETEQQLAKTEMIPLHPVQLGFFSKFYELQLKMLWSSKDTVMEHRFSSEPTEWPLMDRNIAYWCDPRTYAQIHLLGNPVLWLSATVGVLLYCGLLVFYMLRRHRNCYDIEPDEWERFVKIGCILLAGFLANYLPYFMTDGTLFLHHYLPALYFKLLLLGAIIEHTYTIVVSIPQVELVYQMVVIAWLTMAFLVFSQLTAFCYGNTPVTLEDISRLKWRDTWDFLQAGGLR